jgi:hypothetical protein
MYLWMDVHKKLSRSGSTYHSEFKAHIPCTSIMIFNIGLFEVNVCIFHDSMAEKLGDWVLGFLHRVNFSNWIIIGCFLCMNAALVKTFDFGNFRLEISWTLLPSPLPLPSPEESLSPVNAYGYISSSGVICCFVNFPF